LSYCIRIFVSLLTRLRSLRYFGLVCCGFALSATLLFLSEVTF